MSLNNSNLSLAEKIALAETKERGQKTEKLARSMSDPKVCKLQQFFVAQMGRDDDGFQPILAKFCRDEAYSFTEAYDDTVDLIERLKRLDAYRNA